MSSERKIESTLPPKDPPWNSPEHAFIPGRYFVALWFIAIPADDKKGYPKGGNITLCLWRYESTPNEWVIKYRFRKYKDERVFDHEDDMSWYAAKLSGAESVVEERAVKFLGVLCGATGLYFISEPPKLERLEIRGDSEKFREVVLREKPDWLQVGKVEKREQ